MRSVRHLLGLGSGADPRDSRGYTPLHLAAKTGREAPVAALLEGGADPDVVGKGPYRWVARLNSSRMNVVNPCYNTVLYTIANST